MEEILFLNGNAYYNSNTGNVRNTGNAHRIGGVRKTISRVNQMNNYDCLMIEA